MTVDKAIDCVRNDWGVTCPVGQRQAAEVLMQEVIRFRMQAADVQAERKEKESE